MAIFTKRAAIYEIILYFCNLHAVYVLWYTRLGMHILSNVFKEKAELGKIYDNPHYCIEYPEITFFVFFSEIMTGTYQFF